MDWGKPLKYINSSIFWDVTPCSRLKVNRSFGETYRLHLQGWRVNQEINQHEAGRKTSFISLFRLAFRGLHGVISHKIQLFITTAVRTSNSTLKYLSGEWSVGQELNSIPPEYEEQDHEILWENNEATYLSVASTSNDLVTNVDHKDKRESSNVLWKSTLCEGVSLTL
jgi:hypothetical protein